MNWAIYHFDCILNSFEPLCLTLELSPVRFTNRLSFGFQLFWTQKAGKFRSIKFSATKKKKEKFNCKEEKNCSIGVGSPNGKIHWNVSFVCCTDKWKIFNRSVFMWCGVTLWSNYLLKPQNTFTSTFSTIYSKLECYHGVKPCLVELIFDVHFLVKLVIETLHPCVFERKKLCMAFDTN